MLLFTSCATNAIRVQNSCMQSDKAEFTHSSSESHFNCTLSSKGWCINFNDSLLFSSSTHFILEIESGKVEKFVSEKEWFYVPPKFDSEITTMRHYYGAEQVSDSIIILTDLLVHRVELIEVESQETQNLIQEVPNSVIFKKSQNNIWEIASPNYSTIVAAGIGFITKTPRIDAPKIGPDFDGIFIFKDSSDIHLDRVETERFVWLDANLSAKSFLDYYDFNNITDLGFGLQFETDNGSFFVTYEGKAITNDVWDRFEIENDQLKAIGVSNIKYFVF